MEGGDPRFLRILDEMRELHVLKAQDYGEDEDPLANLRASEDFGIPAWLGTMIRGNDKVKRLQAFAKKGKLANEGVIDSLNDLACYAILARILYEETLATQVKDGQPFPSGRALPMLLCGSCDETRSNVDGLSWWYCANDHVNAL